MADTKFQHYQEITVGIVSYSTRKTNDKGKFSYEKCVEYCVMAHHDQGDVKNRDGVMVRSP